MHFCSAINRGKVSTHVSTRTAPEPARVKEATQCRVTLEEVPGTGTSGSRHLVTGTGPGGRDGGSPYFEVTTVLKLDRLKKAWINCTI